MIKDLSDVLVFFGATGDLAYKKIFPELAAMRRRDGLDMPIIGVAKSGWNLDQLRERACDSLVRYSDFDTRTFETLAGLLPCIDGDYADATTFDALNEAMGQARWPARYLAIPPVYPYEPGAWSALELDQKVVPDDGWENPVVAA